MNWSGGRGPGYNESAMHVTIQLAPNLEGRLRREAARHGLEPEAYIARALEEHLRDADSRGGNGAGGTSGTSGTVVGGAEPRGHETDLLQKINLGLPSELWVQYRELIDKRDACTLTPQEQQTLVAISDRIEEANARRMGYLAELARARGVRLEVVMQDLGVGGGSRG
jgi:hypothetical protein